jgi:Zn-finger protein
MICVNCGLFSENKGGSIIYANNGRKVYVCSSCHDNPLYRNGLRFDVDIKKF